MPAPLTNDVTSIQPGDVFSYHMGKPRVCVVWAVRNDVVYFISYEHGDKKPIQEATFLSSLESREIAKLHTRVTPDEDFWFGKEESDE